MQTVAEDFDLDNNRWILNIENTDEGLNRAMLMIKAALAANKLNAKKLMQSEGLRPISDFIEECCEPSVQTFTKKGNSQTLIKSEELRRRYCDFCNLSRDKVSAIKFGRMMTDYIESDSNKYNVERKAVRTGAAYSGVSIKDAVKIINKLNNLTDDHDLTPDDEETTIKAEEPPEPLVKIPSFPVNKAPSPFIPPPLTIATLPVAVTNVELPVRVNVSHPIQLTLSVANASKMTVPTIPKMTIPFKLN